MGCFLYFFIMLPDKRGYVNKSPREKDFGDGLGLILKTVRS